MHLMLWLHTVMLPLNRLWLRGEDVLTCKINTGGLNECVREGRELWLNWWWWMTILNKLLSYTDIKCVLIHVWDRWDNSTSNKPSWDIWPQEIRILSDEMNVKVKRCIFGTLQAYFPPQKESHSIWECFPSPQQSVHQNLIMKLADGPRSSRTKVKKCCRPLR